jgi:hypothetical protein
VRKAIADGAGTPATMPLADIEPFVKSEIVKWADGVKRAEIKVQ